MTKESNRIHKLLSIQSHVVHGYVGNRAATFPLQYRGWDVDAFNTVQFSNHPGYGTFRGTRSTSEELKEISEGLAEIGTEYDAILTGYIPNDEGLRAITEICSNICRKKHIQWILDPVLGDNGRIYVSEGNIEIYKEILKSGYVNLVTPNQLEIEVLTGCKVNSLESLRNALNEFQKQYSNIENVVVTSVQFEDDKDHLYSAGSTKCSDGVLKTFYYKVPSIKASFSGSGDLFSGLLTSAYFKYLDQFEGVLSGETLFDRIPLSRALNEVLSIVEKVLLLTYDYEVAEYKRQNKVLPEPLRINDLKLIQAREYYLQDLASFDVKPL